MVRYFAFALLLLWSMPAFAADLAWDLTDDFGQVAGWVVYYNDYQRTIDKTEVEVEGTTVLFRDIYPKLNIHYGVEYTFHLTAYNTAGETGSSNTVLHTRAGYTPPANVLPPVVINIPGVPSITINIGQ